MDFATLKKKWNEFESVSEALESLRLIWGNCLLFNIEGSEIASQAIQLGNECEDLIQVRESCLETFSATFILIL